MTKDQYYAMKEGDLVFWWDTDGWHPGAVEAKLHSVFVRCSDTLCCGFSRECLRTNDDHALACLSQ